MARVILSVGSNIEAEKNLKLASETLSRESKLLDKTEAIVTEPDGYKDQDDFLNAAYLIETELNRDQLKNYLRSLESRQGRVRGPIPSGPRTLDLDIIIWNGEVIHNDYPQKDYIRIPVDEICKRNRIEIK